ncbi:AAA family ATPase [Clostridiaceae bacterium M8S5]|nr:AAA family ATPase [Clostridiaceae bacterium M8S5]
MYIVPVLELTNNDELSELEFKTTDDISAEISLIGQERAKKALHFGLHLNQKGYNVFVCGVNGCGKSSYSTILAKRLSKDMDVPSDWCYVYNFKKSYKPNVLRLKSGYGAILKKELEILINRLKIDVPKIFNSKEYEERKNDIYNAHKIKIEEVVDKLNLNAINYDFKFTMTENGLTPMPLSLHHLRKIEDISSQLNQEIQSTLRHINVIESQLVNRIKQLDGKVAFDLVDFHIKPVLQKFYHNNDVVNFLEEIEDDIVKNYKEFLCESNSLNCEFLNRYVVNLFIDNSQLKSAPVIRELNPTYSNLLGSIEYTGEIGALRTDHTKIRAGSLHESNGGFLIVNAKELLEDKEAWQGLKRALISKKITIENPPHNFNMVESIKPQPIDLNIKIIIIGDDETYQSLNKYDDEFNKLFKIKAEFNSEMDRTTKNIINLSGFVANMCKQNKLLPFDKSAIKEIINYSSRLAGAKNKLTCCFNDIQEAIFESEAISRFKSKKIVSLTEVQEALVDKKNREGRYEEILNELIINDMLLIDTSGKKVGQINGLSVVESGKYLFARPNKITASTFLGKEGIINIEREADQSGSIYDKSVYIITGYLGGKYAQKRPLSLNASITFEQSYDYIDGDSASSAELYAILSSLSLVPINQSIAVTGSVNQKGVIQPIGAVNEKIEGYFDLCDKRGLTGEEGVIIPKQNINDLMLKKEVIEAVAKQMFTIYAISTIDEGIEVLTGIKAGKIDKKGNYCPGTMHYFVQKKLESYALLNKDYE